MIVYAADDENLQLLLLKKAIKKVVPGSEPQCFRHSSELLDAASKRNPDIVFLDIEMPGMTGLELAKKLNELNNDIKIIFVTGYDKYALEAFNLYASGYLLKPCSSEKIREILSKNNLIPQKSKSLVITTFGNFNVKFKGRTVHFHLEKSKQMLAYLVDRNGALVSRKEMAGILFGDDFSRNAQSNLSHIASKLNKDLKNAGIENFFFNNDGYFVDMSNAECDLTHFLNGETSLFIDEYMEQYSWAEYRKNELKKIKLSFIFHI